MKTKDLYAILLMIILIVPFFIITGTVTSGYHFIDDHEILLITQDLSKESILSVATKRIRRDLNSRFRPLYYIHRVLEAKAFGKNLTVWSVYTIFLLFNTLICFYFGMRKLKFSIFESLCFLLLAFIGPQMAIWWRLGPNETIGMFFLGLAFYFMVNCNERYSLNTLLFGLFLICASLCKESFVIIIPAFLVFKIWYEIEFYNWNVKRALLKNYLLLIPFFVMIINLLIIVFWVGTNKIGYAGVDGGILPLLKGMLSIVKKQFKQYIIILAFFLVAIYFELKDEKKMMLFTKKIALPFLFCILVIAPNIILYAKSGMHERYLLPSFVGISFVAVAFIKETRLNYRWLSSLFLAVIVAFSIKPSYEAILKGRQFTIEGNKTNIFLSSILKNYKKSSNILLVADPVLNFERSASLDRYLSIEKGIECYAYAVEDHSSWGRYSDIGESLTERWYSWFHKRMSSDMQGRPNIILFISKDLAQRFFNESGIQKEKYSNILEVNIKRNAQYAIFRENK